MYKKLRFYLRFLRAIFSKYFWTIVAGALLGTLSFFAVPQALRFTTYLRPAYKIGLVGRHTIPEMPATILDKISLGLTVLGPDGLPASGLASSWTATDSGKTYTFTLADGFNWHDGSPVISNDINYNFRDAQVSYPDPTHLIIHLNDPFSPLPAVVSRPLLKITSLPRRYLGVGEYKIQYLRRNGPFLESVSLTPSSRSLPPLTYFFYATQSQARTALKLGVLDAVEDLTDIGDLDLWPNLNITPSTQSHRFTAVFYNLDDPVFQGTSGKNFRLALAYAIDKSRWPETRSFGPITPDSWAYNPDIKKYDLDLDRAKSLLADTDLPDHLTLSVVPAYLDVAEQVKSDWEAVGLTVELSVRQDIPDSFQALIVAQAVPPDPDQYNLWHSTQATTNLTHLANPRIDKLLEDGRKTSDPKQRLIIYRDFQRYLSEELPAVFLFHPQTYTVSRK